MKILFSIGTLYPSQQGGPSNTVYWIAKALSNKGVEVTIVTTNVGAEGKILANQWLNTSYGRIIYHSTIFQFLPWRVLKSTITAIPNCDLVHLTSFFYPPSVISALAAYWYGKPIVWSPRGELDQLALVYSTWKKRPILWFIRRFFSNKSIFHSTSLEETQRIKEILGQSVQVVEIPNFLELPTFVVSVPTTPPYILCIGRIHRIKAIENLIVAVSNSPTFISLGINLIIAGDSDNPYGEQLKMQVEDMALTEKIQFIGHIEGQSKQKLYANAYCTILPSNTENFGNVVVESLAQGTPVIASKGTPWEVLSEYEAGYWVENNAVSLSKTIDLILTLRPEKYSSMRRNARQLCEKKFDINKNIDKWIETYSTVLHE